MQLVGSLANVGASGAMIKNGKGPKEQYQKAKQRNWIEGPRLLQGDHHLAEIVGGHLSKWASPARPDGFLKAAWEAKAKLKSLPVDKPPTSIPMRLAAPPVQMLITPAALTPSRSGAIKRGAVHAHRTPREAAAMLQMRCGLVLRLRIAWTAQVPKSKPYKAPASGSRLQSSISWGKS